MQNLSILNISQNYYVRGGSDRYYFCLAELLENQGHRVIPFASNQAENQKTIWSKYFPVAVNFDSPKPNDIFRFIYSQSAAKSINKLIQDHNPQVAHLHIYYGQLTSSILSPLKKAGIPIIQTLHEYKLVCPVYTLVSNGNICETCAGRYFWQATLKRCNRGSWTRSLLSTVESYVSHLLGAVDQIDRFITVSHFQREKLIELGVPAAKLTTVHNFIDTSLITPAEKLGDYFLYFGRIEQLKGIFTLVEAAASIPDVPLLIVGDGKARFELENLIEQRNLKHIHILGSKRGKELQELIRNSICSILPSEWYENCPMSILESLAYGRPVIGTKIGGIPELIRDGVDGFLIPCGNTELLREKMLWLANNRHKALAMGLQGREKIETEFNSSKHYTEIMNIYDKVL
jgi:glycosyltransferase involved in cell wall biosynthesis